MRQLDSYWPGFLREIYEFQQLAGAEHPEFELAWQRALAAPQDLFLFSLTEYGVERWEGLLGIPYDSTLSLEQRRTRIITRLMLYPPYTLSYVQQIMDQLAGAPGRIVLSVDGWTLTETVSLEDTFLLREARQMLLQIKPAAVVLIERRIAEHDVALYLGGVSQMYRMRDGGVAV